MERATGSLLPVQARAGEPPVAPKLYHYQNFGHSVRWKHYDSQPPELTVEPVCESPDRRNRQAVCRISQALAHMRPKVR